jgi:hypothetical protein
LHRTNGVNRTFYESLKYEHSGLPEIDAGLALDEGVTRLPKIYSPSALLALLRPAGPGGA